MLSFSLLGQVAITKYNTPLDKFRSQKETALLIYLAQTGQTHQRDFLADLLWDSRSTKQSLSNLRTVLTRLRPKVGDALHVTPKSVALTQENQHQVDSVILLQTLNNIGQVNAAQSAITLQKALDTYQGQFLAEFQLPNAPQFNEWMVMTREQIHRQVIAAFDKLRQFALLTGNTELGMAVARRWLQVDDLDEMAHTLLIQMLLKTGNVGEATAHYHYCETLLRTQLGIEPPPQITALINRVQPEPSPKRYPPPTLRHNLPTPYDQFFGRKTTQQEIHIRLDQPWCRLVTIVGQGGVGKTRLATTIARNRLSQYPDGVWLVELADLNPDDEHLAEAIAVEIATTLNMRLTGSEDPAGQLLNYLKHKQMMLILDNFEHLFDGVQIVLDIIRQCETIQLLVTSREPLRLRAEWVITLGGLTYPNHNSDEIHSDAVELFLARWVQHQGTILADELVAIRAICRMVEGLPLAIELAAALPQHITPQRIADGLGHGFNELTTSLRDVPRRHHNLHVVFEMSWRILAPTLQQCLARLALFRAGFTAAAAQQIAQTTLPQLSELTQKSLLTYHAAVNRYTIHPIIRVYAAEKRSPADLTPQKHAHYYLTFLAQHTEPLQKKRPQDSINSLAPDIDNIRLAWQTALADRQVNLLFAALTSLSIYYQLSGLAHEAETLMQTTANTAITWETNGLELATRARLEQARFQNRLGRYRLAIQTSQTALRLADQIGDRWAEAMGRVFMAESLWRLGDYDLATAKLNDALNIAQKLKATEIVGWCHHHLGIINDIQNRYVIAHEHLQQACQAWQVIDNAQALSGSLNSIGLVYYNQGDLQAAQQAIEQALAICEQLDDHHRQSSLVNNLSLILTERGDYMGARYYLQLGLELAITTGNLTGQAELNINLGKNYRLLGEYGGAVERLEQGGHLSELIGNYSLMATAFIYLADAKREMGALKQAQSLYKQALEVGRQRHLHLIECTALVGLAELSSELQDKRAVQYSTEAIGLAETVNNLALLERARAIQQNLKT